MRVFLANRTLSSKSPHAGGEGNIRIILLVVVCFLVGLAVGILAFHRAARPGQPTGGRPTAGNQAPSLSASTQALLRRLNSPVEIRYYSMLDPATTSPALRAFASRVGKMLSEYEREAHGEIKVTRHTALSNANADAASADGLQPFNLEKGEACYLGMAVVHGDHKVSLPRLSLEWKQAVEFDLSRAIERVLRPQAPAHPLPATSPANVAAVRQVKRLIPNLDSISVEQGTEQLREAALKEFKNAAQTMSGQVKEAQKRLSQAQTPSEQQAAMKALRQVQAQQTEKLQEIAARLQAQIKALKQLKSE